MLMRNLDWFSEDPVTINRALALLEIAKTYPDYKEGWRPPGWGDANYDPPNKGYTIAIVSIVMMSLAFIFVVTRILVRTTWRGMNMGLDDWMIIPATLFTIAYTYITVFAVVHGGLGRHVWDNNWDELSIAMKYSFIHIYIYAFALYFTKLSILLFIRRLTAPTNLAMHWIIKGMIVFFTATTIVTICVTTFQCTPVSSAWSLAVRIQGRKCIDLPAAMLAQSTIYALGDIAVLILPVRMIWRLQLPWTSRVGILVLFSLGGFAVVCSVVKMAFIDASYRYYDFTWNSAYSLFFGLMEACVGIMTASLPALNVILIRFVPTKLRTAYRSTRVPSGATQRSKKTASGGGQPLPISPSHSRKGSGNPSTSEKDFRTIETMLEEDEESSPGPRDGYSSDPAVKYAYHSTISQMHHSPSASQSDAESANRLSGVYPNPLALNNPHSHSRNNSRGHTRGLSSLSAHSQGVSGYGYGGRPITTVDEFWDDYYGDLLVGPDPVVYRHSQRFSRDLRSASGAPFGEPARNSSSNVLATEFAEAMRRAKLEHDAAVASSSPPPPSSAMKTTLVTLPPPVAGGLSGGGSQLSPIPATPIIKAPSPSNGGVLSNSPGGISMMATPKRWNTAETENSSLGFTPESPERYQLGYEEEEEVLGNLHPRPRQLDEKRDSLLP